MQYHISLLIFVILSKHKNVNSNIVQYIQAQALKILSCLRVFFVLLIPLLIDYDFISELNLTDEEKHNFAADAYSYAWDMHPFFAAEDYLFL